VIFITVGTEKFPFDRLLKAIDAGIESGRINHDVFAQCGTSEYAPINYAHTDFLSFDEMLVKIQQADIVVSHSGVGSTLLCLSLGKIPVLFPRSAQRGEHLDDHQLEFTRQMEKHGMVIAAYSEQELLSAISGFAANISVLQERKMIPGKDALLTFLGKTLKGYAQTD